MAWKQVWLRDPSGEQPWQEDWGSLRPGAEDDGWKDVLLSPEEQDAILRLFAIPEDQ